MLLCVLAASLATLAQAAGPAAYPLAAGAAGSSMAAYTGFFVDHSGALTIQDVRSQSGLARFVYSGAPITRVGSDDAVWFILRLSQRDFDGSWLLSLPYTHVHDLQFYGPIDPYGRELADPVFTGSAQPYRTRPLGNENFLMPLNISLPGEYTVFVRAVSPVARNYEFRVWEVPEFHAQSQPKRLFDGICYGIVVGMLTYNLMLLIVFRDRTYALYVLSTSAALLYMAGANGHLARYVLSDWPLLVDRLHTMVPALWIALGSLFAHSFLSMERYAPVLGRLVLTITVASTSNLLLAAGGMSTLAQSLNENLSLGGTALVVLAGLLALHQGYKPAAAYLVGQLTLFSAVLTTVLINWGLLDAPFVYNNGLQTGVALEVMVFAFALSSRIRLMQAMHTELTLRTQTLAQASQTDPLTGVANRSGLTHHAQELLSPPLQCTLILLDLDKFKPINDIHGHQAGDAVLVEIARRLKAQVREGDTVARIGGDEFVVLLGQQHERHALELVSQRLLEVIAQPVVFAGQTLHVGGSLGIARYPGNGLTLADLLQAADVAMYHIKKTGRANYAFFDDMADSAAATGASAGSGSGR